MCISFSLSLKKYRERNVYKVGERERERREREVCVSSNVMYEYDDGWGIFGREVKENGYQESESRAWAISENQPIQRFYSFFSFSLLVYIYSSLLYYVYFILRCCSVSAQHHCLVLFQNNVIYFFFKKVLALNPMKVTINKTINV